MTTRNLTATIAAFEAAHTAFDRALDRLSDGFATIETAIQLAISGAASLPQLADSLTFGKQQLAAARSTLDLAADERGIARYVDSEHWLAESIEARIRTASTDAKTIARQHEDFLEHEPADRIAVASGLRGTWQVRQAVDQLKRAALDASSMAKQLREADLAFTIARLNMSNPSEPLGARYALYLDRYARLADEFAAAM